VGRPEKLSVERKMQIVLAVLEGETTIVRAARETGVSATAVSNWKRQFLEAGVAGLSGGAPRGSEREARLLAQNEALKASLLEAEVLARVWKMSAEHLKDARGGGG
jgi:transposase